ncbi:hypothetical protein [Longimicrobium sp.]|uniref:hypothetical protein n=1 Tax=Longimicrobium sp. TaxID=2029185 RepID=UPI003B3BE3A7
MYDPDAPLPEMLGVAPPEHDARGHILVLLVHGMGATVLGWSVLAPAYDAYEVGEWVLIVVLGVLVCAGIGYLADGMRRFKCWVWFFVMGWLVPAMAVGLGELLFGTLTPEDGIVIVGTMMVMGAVHYLWARRREFWVDARLEARRPRHRSVTPEWRAARLARIGAGPGGERRTVSPRPGALWLRRASAGRG